MLRHLRYEKKAIEKKCWSQAIGVADLAFQAMEHHGLLFITFAGPSLSTVTQYSPLTGNMNIIKLIITDYTMKSQRICINIYIYIILIYNICMILYMIIYIPSGHQTWQLKFPNLERGFPLPRWLLEAIWSIWSLMLLRVTPPHRCNNCQRLQIQMADELPGWARLLQQLAVTRLAVARSARVSKPFELAEQLGVWQRVKQRVKLSQTWKNMQRVGYVEQNLQRLLYHVISLCGWTLQYCCRMVSEWYTWSVWKDLKLKGFLLSCFGMEAVQDQDRDGGR